MFAIEWTLWFDFYFMFIFFQIANPVAIITKKRMTVAGMVIECVVSVIGICLGNLEMFVIPCINPLPVNVPTTGISEEMVSQV